jgi:hypothetical protein
MMGWEIHMPSAASIPELGTPSPLGHGGKTFLKKTSNGGGGKFCDISSYNDIL